MATDEDDISEEAAVNIRSLQEQQQRINAKVMCKKFSVFFPCTCTKGICVFAFNNIQQFCS